MKFLKALCETPGIPGREERVRELLQKHTEGWWDSSEVDRVGNLWGRLKASTPNCGDEKSVVIACHMDQIGFYVRHVDDEGFLRIQQAGGFDTRNLFARRVLVMTSKGGDIVGILNPATKPVHVASPEERKKIPDVSEFVIDTGLSKEKIKEIVRPGDPVVLEQTTIEMGDHVCGQCMDNRISQWVALNAIEKAKGKTVYDIDWVGTVQEEVGLRGATVAAQTSKADVGIAIDVTLAVDTPGISITPVHTMGGERTNITYYDDVKVDDKYRVGEVDGGWKVMMTALVFERNSAWYGELVRLLDHGLGWARATASPAGGRMIDDPLVRERLARIAVGDEVSNLLGWRAAWMAAEGTLPGVEGTMAKLFTTEHYQWAANELVDALGAEGVRRHGDPTTGVDDGWIEAIYRHCQVTTIYGGTSEVLRGIVAERGLGLPRNR